MKFLVNKNTKGYLLLFANCFIVKGYTRTMICDTQNKIQYFIGNDFAEVLITLKTLSIGEVFKMLDDSDSEHEFINLVKFLLENNLAMIVDDPSIFPDIELKWEHPSKIVNAIIDIRNINHDFEKIFIQLNQLGCYYIQIRAYTALSKEQLFSIISSIENKAFRNVHIFSKFQHNEKLYEELDDILKKNLFISLTIHSTPAQRIKNYSSLRILFVSQAINSCNNCGIINEAYLRPVSLTSFMENTKFNGCLNRKISIDEAGYIKNCPSMGESYGNINETSLIDVLENENFKSFWHLKKDDFLVCRDCEYRYVCSDCRAYTENDNLLGKPAKCSYDPYKGVWE